jgi:hypothetical protein
MQSTPVQPAHEAGNAKTPGFLEEISQNRALTAWAEPGSNRRHMDFQSIRVLLHDPQWLVLSASLLTLF